MAKLLGKGGMNSTPGTPPAMVDTPAPQEQEQVQAPTPQEEKPEPVKDVPVVATETNSSDQQLGELSRAGENSTADPALVAQDPNDSGGWSYGLYQFSSSSGVVQDFVSWLQKKPAPYDEYGNQLAQSGRPTCDESFADKWRELGVIDPGGFGNLQDEYATSLYFDEGANRLISCYGFNPRDHSIALQQVLFSNCVQHGTYWGSEIIHLAIEATGEEYPSDKDIIYYVYEIKLTDMSWSSGAPNDRPGLFARWNRERDMAISRL